MRFEGVVADVLHAIDLGAATQTIPKLMVCIMKSGKFGATEDGHLTNLNAHLKSWYRTTRKQNRINGS